MALDYSLLLIFPGLMAFAAMMDLFTMTIPNRISIMLFVAFLIIAPLTGMAWEHYCFRLATGFAVLAVGILLFHFCLLGGGDAKLLAAASVWLGLDSLLQFVVVAALMGGGLAIALLIYRGVVPPRWLLSQSWALRLHNQNEGIPYGLALAGAALWVFPTTEWFTAVAA